jgi:tetratricopeptide (TPR) repeat protein
MLIQARFAQLHPDQAALVRAAAVIGHAIPAWLFAAVTGAESDAPAMVGLADADFLYPGDISGTLRFKHGIARDAVYRTIGLDERKALHRRVVEALHAAAETSGDAPYVDALAHHLAASGDLAAAIPYAIKAGDAALAAGAVDRAQAHYRAAFEALATAPGDAESGVLIWKLVNKYGLACITDPSPEQTPVLGRMAIRLAALGHSEALVRSRYWIGAIAYGLGDGRRSATELAAALALAREHGQDRLIPQIELKLAQSLFAAGDYHAAEAMFLRVLPVVQAGAGRNDRETVAYGLCCHAFLLADQGHFSAADLRYAEAGLLLDGAAVPLRASCLTQMPAVSLMRGEWHAALEQAEHCIAVCGPTHARYQAMMAQALGAYARWQIDRAPDAIETLVGTARWFAFDASRQRTSLIHGWLAEIMERTGDAAQARLHAARAIRRVRDGGDRLGECMAYNAMARLAARGDGRRRPAQYLARAYHSAALRRSPRDHALTETCEAELALAAGEDARAVALLDRAAAAFEAMGAPVFAARARALSPTNR